MAQTVARRVWSVYRPRELRIWVSVQAVLARESTGLAGYVTCTARNSRGLRDRCHVSRISTLRLSEDVRRSEGQKRGETAFPSDHASPSWPSDGV